jgi:hypothetical protein
MHRKFSPWAPNALLRLRQQLSFDGKTVARQDQVGAAIGIGLDRYFRLEHGTTDPTPREVAALARLFNVPPGKLGFKTIRTNARVAIHAARKRA